ncbi:MAG: TolC family protein [Planctomycetaceae bacterium]|nr:TolC family protein [Planctomycetales bacterium]MCB9874536.1 TolC family protein [Planctomycetaceae bacterium]MCB9941592.1 TolC family protein [Planctomycetaceae bacterium]
MAASLRVCFLLLLVVLAGCSRRHYRQRADVDAYSAIHEKARQTPWDTPLDYDIVPMPGSRLFDPTPQEDPLLPMPAPQLYAYDLPQLPDRDPARFQQRLRSDNLGIDRNPFPEVQVASHVPNFVRLPEVSRRATTVTSPNELQRVTYMLDQSDDRGVPMETSNSELPAPNDVPSLELEGSDIVLAPVPVSAWEDIPRRCQVRMFEFESIREEFRLTFGDAPSDAQRDDAQALALEDIIELALLNSREYQTQKETLYRAALRLSLQRFDYDLKFSTSGNRIATDYTHARDGGIEVNRLRVPSSYQVDKMLATGGTVLLRFANNLVLTFNGANGFATDIGSDIVLDIQQTLLQVDVQFEPLTQAERDVVYAARNFARFRKTFYADLTSQYYTLIRTYRQVEIDSQNYLTLARAFRQAEYEYRARQVPRFEIDQVEQNVLSGRSRLIGTCNNLEQSLDNLKIRIGLPTETPIDIDLTELEQLTRYDELAVRRELVRRVQKRLLDERNSEEPERVVLLSSAIDLIDRILGAFDVLRQLGEEPPEDSVLRDLRARLSVQLARTDANSVRRELEQELLGGPPNNATLYGRTIDLADRLLTLIDHQIELATLRGQTEQSIADMKRTAAELHERKERLDEEDDLLIQRLTKPSDGAEDEVDHERFIEELRRLVSEVTALRQACEDFVVLLDQVNGAEDVNKTPSEALASAIRIVDDLIARTGQLLSPIGGGLTPIETEFDDAMMTALTLRFDLMNQRGALADQWRQIKLAADDLKSVLNLRATQTVRSPGASPFDFTFDESLTQLNATLDLPLNRRAQRNTFRQNLINYQVSLRQLMLLEDNIKLAVRNDLRALALDQQQYQVDVASAGLAYERVVSTQIERNLGIGGVTARDYLQSQDAYISALSSVASRHINYIVDRMQLFLDTEVLTVDERGLWDGLYDESVQLTPFYQLPSYAFPFYGELPRGLHYSREMRRMEQVPPGNSMFHRSPTDAELQPVPEDIEAPSIVPIN